MPINSKRDITFINQVHFGHNKLLWSRHRTVARKSLVTHFRRPFLLGGGEGVKGLAKSQVVLENVLNNLELRLDKDILFFLNEFRF